jgi:hypothetical protein
MSQFVVRLREDQDPYDLPRPRGLRGGRRTFPIGKLTDQTKRGIAQATRTFQQRLVKRYTKAGALDRVWEDASKRLGEKVKAGPVGRGAHPLGPDRRQEIRGIFDYETMQFIAELTRNDIDDFELELRAALDDSYLDMFDAGGRAAQTRLGVKANFKLRNPFVVDALRTRANLLSGGVADDVFDRIRTIIADEFYLQGKNPLDVASALTQEFDFLSRARAELIARTETLAVVEEAQHTVYDASGVEFKRWLTTLDGRERDSHFEAHGQIQPMDEAFDVGQAKLMWPGDPDGPPEEICNCRCDMIPIITAGQIFSQADVWAGDVDPDEFATNRAA